MAVLNFIVQIKIILNNRIISLLIILDISDETGKDRSSPKLNQGHNTHTRDVWFRSHDMFKSCLCCQPEVLLDIHILAYTFHVRIFFFRF